MKIKYNLEAITLCVLIGAGGVLLTGCAEEQESTAPPPPAPAEYADKHMPAGWWTDEKILAEGKEIYEGVKNIDVNCSSCHGKDGKPVKAGARDFRKTERMKMYSDSVWFWRVSEGVPNTKMKAWKSKLSEEDRWKVAAYEHTFGLKGQGWDPVAQQWVQADQIGKGAPAGASGPGPGEPKPVAGEPAPKPSEPQKSGK
jgi:mono/diheme cytochrome c family protein